MYGASAVLPMIFFKGLFSNMIRVTWSHVAGAVPAAVPLQGAVAVVAAAAVATGTEPVTVRAEAASNTAAEIGAYVRIGMPSLWFQSTQALHALSRVDTVGAQDTAQPSSREGLPKTWSTPWRLWPVLEPSYRIVPPAAPGPGTPRPRRPRLPHPNQRRALHGLPVAASQTTTVSRW